MECKRTAISVDFILEAFEYELSLLIFILSNPVFSIELFLLPMKHMSAKVKHCALVHFGSLPFCIAYLLPYLFVF